MLCQLWVLIVPFYTEKGKKDQRGLRMEKGVEMKRMYSILS